MIAVVEMLSISVTAMAFATAPPLQLSAPPLQLSAPPMQLAAPPLQLAAPPPFQLAAPPQIGQPRASCFMSANINNAYFADCFAECMDAAALRKRYRGLAGVYHPDAPGGNAETFQRIASEYERRLEVLKASDPLDVEIQEALAELTEALSALASQTLKQAVGSQAFSRIEDATRSGWRWLWGATSDLLEASDTTDASDSARPPNERKGLGRRAVSFIGSAFSRVRRGRSRQD